MDKWLWHARFFKTRSLAARVVTGGHCRVNSARISKPSQAISNGEVLTFVQAEQVRVIKVVALSRRRGPAPEAAALYEDLTPPQENGPPPVKTAGKGRPTKKDRRNMRLSRDLPLE